MASGKFIHVHTIPLCAFKLFRLKLLETKHLQYDDPLVLIIHEFAGYIRKINAMKMCTVDVL